MHYADMLRDPLGVMRNLYEWAGDELSPIYEPESLPYGGFHRGAEAGMRLFEQICTVWKDLSFDVESPSPSGTPSFSSRSESQRQRRASD